MVQEKWQWLKKEGERLVAIRDHAELYQIFLRLAQLINLVALIVMSLGFLLILPSALISPGWVKKPKKDNNSLFSTLSNSFMR